MTTERRRRAWREGRLAERLACWMLRAKGYRIVGRDVRTSVGEIDIVARRGPVLAVIEVKYRRSLRIAAESLTERQRLRIERATLALLQQRPELAGLDVRFDAVLAAPGGMPRHLPDAWRPEAPR